MSTIVHFKKCRQPPPSNIEHQTQLFGKEPMHRKEFRGYLGALRRIASQPSHWHLRHLILMDNLGDVLALSKGRCKDARILMLVRNAAALVLATGLAVTCGWVPSEANAADQPSRAWERRSRVSASGRGARPPRRMARSCPSPKPMPTTSRGPMRTMHTILSLPPPRPRRKRRTITPVPPILAGMTFLETASVQPVTRDSYCRLLEVFLRWADLVTVATDAKRLDHLLCQYFQRLYTEGRGPGAGSKLIAAILFVYPSQAGRGRPALDRALRALKGWKRKMPAATRQPLPCFVAMAIASDLRRRWLPLMSLCWILMFDTYMRPGECIDLLASQIVPPQPGAGMRQAAILLNPGYREKFSKTGELDESLLVSRRWLSDLIAEYAQLLMPSGPL